MSIYYTKLFVGSGGRIGVFFFRGFGRLTGLAGLLKLFLYLHQLLTLLLALGLTLGLSSSALAFSAAASASRLA